MLRSKSEMKRMAIQGAFDRAAPVSIMDALDILTDLPQELEERIRHLLALGYAYELNELDRFSRGQMISAFEAGWHARTEFSVIPPHVQACNDWMDQHFPERQIDLGPQMYTCPTCHKLVRDDLNCPFCSPCPTCDGTKMEIIEKTENGRVFGGDCPECGEDD